MAVESNAEYFDGWEEFYRYAWGEVPGGWIKRRGY